MAKAQSKTTTAVMLVDGAQEFLNLDGKGLLKFVQQNLAAYHEAYKRIALSAVLCIRHAAKHGDADALNLLYSGLHQNDRAALRNYIRRIAIVVGLGLTSGTIPEQEYSREVIKAAAGNAKDVGGAFLTFSGTNEEFAVIKNDRDPRVSKNKAKVVELCETQLIAPNPTVNGWMRFNERSIIQDFQEIGDSTVVKNIFRMVSRYLANENERVHIKLTPKTKKFLEEIKSKAEDFIPSFAVQDEAEATERRTKAAAQAAATREAAGSQAGSEKSRPAHT